MLRRLSFLIAFREAAAVAACGSKYRLSCILMEPVPYEDPANLFRIYLPNECDEEG